MPVQIEARVRNKRDTSANWTAQNPVLLNGEIILVDTNDGELRAKVGDGVKTYTQLPFSDEALRNLISQSSGKGDVLVVELSKTGWSQSAQTIQNDLFVAEGYAYVVSPTNQCRTEYGDADVHAGDVVENRKMEFYCNEVPTVNLYANILRLGVN